MTMAISVAHEEINGVQVLTIGTEALSIDELNLEEISQKLFDLAASIPPQIVINMQYVEFYGSSFIETLFRIWNRIKSSENGAFGITGLQTYCREILQMTNLDSIWAIYDDVDAAVAAISSAENKS